MLDLIRCEFAKTKRRRIILGLVFLACLFPLIMTLANKQGMTGDISENYLKMRFDLVYSITLGYALIFLMPCLIGLSASMLFFMERDNDTFKNIRVIPISMESLILAKVLVLFIYSIFFSFSSVTFTMIFTKIFSAGIIYDIGYKLGMSIIFGIIITIASLPIVVIIVYFNKSYLISAMLAFFYSILNWGIMGVFGTNISEETVMVFNLFPIICGMNWTAGNMVDHLVRENISAKAFILYPSNAYTVAILAVTLVVSLVLMFRFYKKWTR